MKRANRKSLRFRGTQCLNCGHTLKRTDIYCSQCSQLNSKKPLAALDFFDEFLRSILVYDSRMRSTLNDLLFKPGVITKNYVQGQRLKYANPFRFFLSVSIIYFLLRGFISISGFTSDENMVEMNLQPADSIPVTENPAERLSGFLYLTANGDSLKAKKLGVPAYFPETSLDSLSVFDDYKLRGSIFLNYIYAHENANRKTALSALGYKQSFKNKWLYSRMVAVKKIIENPSAFIHYISSKIPFFLFFFTPIFAFAFWLLYPRKKFTYMEHMIFIFHIFSFLFLSMLLFLIPDLLMGNKYLLLLLFFILGPLYFFFALYKFYGQKVLPTIVKFVVLTLVFNIGFIFSTFIFVTIGAAIY